MRASVAIGDPLGAVSPLIYGQYLEHVADCIYPAVWDGEGPVADDLGLRRDVRAAAEELAVPVVRWPGGCFADVYHWEDGVGPPVQRPVRLNHHWGGVESNRFGTDEFLRWCERTGAAPYVNLNLGTGTLDEALRWIDYCTGTEPTADARRRAEHGHPDPYRVALWGIGNETWGSWEAGNLPAGAYARTLANWADFIKRARPEAALTAVGSSEGGDPEWDRAVLEAAGPHLDYLTNHVYGYSVDRTSGAEYLRVAFTPVYVEARLRAMAALTAPYGVRVALDEWNIRHYVPDGDGGHQLDRSSPRTLQDAIFAAGVLNAMVRMSPDVGLANYVFLVNGNGVLSVHGETLVTSTLFHVFRQYRAWMRGTALNVDVRGPGIATPPPQADRPGHAPVPGGVPPRSPYVDAAATRDGADVALALVNRHPDEPATVCLEGGFAPAAAWTLAADDVHAVNDTATPGRVVPAEAPVPAGTAEWTCPPHSVTLLRGRMDP